MNCLTKLKRSFVLLKIRYKHKLKKNSVFLMSQPEFNLEGVS
jgi:hypothetical protein